VALKACTVVVHDLNQTAHSLDVTAESLYEAIARASPRCAVMIGSVTVVPKALRKFLAAKYGITA